MKYNKVLLNTHKMKKTLLLILLCSFGISMLSAQNPLISENPKADTLTPNFGKNRAFYMHGTIAYGVNILNQSDSYEVDPIGSGNFMFAYTFKWRINQLLSGGFDLAYNLYDYKITQDDGKIYPDTIEHEKQNIICNDIGVAPYLRINFDLKRGDHLGYYLDLGAYGGVHINRKLITKDILDSGERQKTILSKFQDLERFNYGVFGRLGLNTFCFYGKYRMSTLLTENSLKDLPPLTVGLQLVIPF